MVLLKEAMMVAARLANQHIHERLSQEQNAHVIRLVVDAVFDMYAQALATQQFGFSAAFRAPHESKLLGLLVEHGLVEQK